MVKSNLKRYKMKVPFYKLVLLAIFALSISNCKKNSEQGSGWNIIGKFKYSHFDDPTLSVDKDGNIYTLKIGEKDSVDHLIKWNGVSWTDLGALPNLPKYTDYDIPEIGSICNDLYGNVFFGGGIIGAGWPSSYFAQYSNGSFQQLQNISATKTNFITDPLGNLYSIGTDGFSSSDSSHLYKFDGVAWTRTMLSVPFSKIGSCAIDAAGNFYILGSDYAGWDINTNTYVYNHYFYKWDGNKWINLNYSDASVQITQMACDPKGNVYALIGYKNISIWNGAGWNTLGNLPNGANAMYIDNQGNIYTITFYNNNYSVMKWDGTTWNDLPGSTLKGSSRIAFDKKSNMFAITTNDTASLVYQYRK